MMTCDIPNAFIQTDAPKKMKGKRIIMKVRDRLVDWLIELDPVGFQKFVVIENGQKVFYLLILRAIYGMLEASLLWYRKFRKDLESVGFIFNPMMAVSPIEQ